MDLPSRRPYMQHHPQITRFLLYKQQQKLMVYNDVRTRISMNKYETLSCRAFHMQANQIKIIPQINKC